MTSVSVEGPRGHFELAASGSCWRGMESKVIVPSGALSSCEMVSLLSPSGLKKGCREFRLHAEVVSDPCQSIVH